MMRATKELRVFYITTTKRLVLIISDLQLSESVEKRQQVLLSKVSFEVLTE